MSWDEDFDEVIHEPDWSCPVIDSVITMIKQDMKDEGAASDCIAELEKLRELHMELRAWGKTGWNRAQDSETIMESMAYEEVAEGYIPLDDICEAILC